MKALALIVALAASPAMAQECIGTADAYAVSNAFTARAQLQGITYHRTRGEVMRVKVAS